MVQKGIFWNIGENLYSVYYPITVYQRIMFKGLKQWIRGDTAGTMVSVGKFFWNNSEIVKYNSSKYYGIY